MATTYFFVFVDHNSSRSRFTKSKLTKAGVPEELLEEYMRDVNRAPNLQLLPGLVNVAKQDTLPGAWAKSHFHDAEQRTQWLVLYDANDLPLDDVVDFGDFFDGRRKLLRGRLEQVLGVDAAPNEAGAPTDDGVSSRVDESAAVV